MEGAGGGRDVFRREPLLLATRAPQRLERVTSAKLATDVCASFPGVGVAGWALGES